MRKAGIPLDDDAARRILTRCRSADRTATDEEIAHFATLKVHQLAKRRNIENWPGLLMAAVPAYFDSPATELAQYRKARCAEREEHQRIARQVLQDPAVTAEEREWAWAILLESESGPNSS